MCKCIQHLRSCSFGPVQAWHKTLTETDISKHMLEAFQWNEGYMEVVPMGHGCKELLAMLCLHTLTIALIYRCRMSETCSSTHNINGDILSKGFDITRLRAFIHSFIQSVSHSFIHSFSQSVSQSVIYGHGLACACACRSRVCTRTLVSPVHALVFHVSNFVHLSMKMTYSGSQWVSEWGVSQWVNETISQLFQEYVKSQNGMAVQSAVHGRICKYLNTNVLEDTKDLRRTIVNGTTFHKCHKIDQVSNSHSSKFVQSTQ